MAEDSASCRCEMRYEGWSCTSIAMSRIAFSISLLLFLATGIFAQGGLHGIVVALGKQSARLDRRVDEHKLSRFCPHTGQWVLHVPTVSLNAPQSQEDFTSGAFSDHLIPIESPKRWGRRGYTGLESYVFDNQASLVGTVSLGETFPSCDLAPFMKANDHELARVHRDSTTVCIVGIHWRTLTGFLYKTNNGWYLISSDRAGLKHEPFARSLQRAWGDLQREGFRPFSVGSWKSF